MEINANASASRPTLKPRYVVVIFALTLLLALPRFAHHTPDSQFYLDLAGYFRGEVERVQLVAPYAYRVLLPWLASIMPLENLDLTIASLNVLFTISAYVAFFWFLREILSTSVELKVALFVLVISFPTLNYSSAVLTDPLGFLLFLLAVYALLKERFLAFSLLVAIGVLARESVLVLSAAAVLYLLLTRKKKFDKSTWFTLGAVVLIPLLAFIAPRIYFADLPSYFWVPSVSRVVSNLVTPVAWATLLLTAAVPVTLLLIGIRRTGLAFLSDPDPQKRLTLLTVTLVSTLLLLYSILTAFMSGRFFWPLYVTLIPMAVMASRETSLFNNWLGPAAETTFGKDDN
jgi:hypothetical protein